MPHDACWLKIEGFALCPVSFCVCICPSSSCLTAHILLSSCCFSCLPLALSSSSRTLCPLRCASPLFPPYSLHCRFFLSKLHVPIHHPFSLHLSSLSCDLALSFPQLLSVSAERLETRGNVAMATPATQSHLRCKWPRILLAHNFKILSFLFSLPPCLSLSLSLPLSLHLITLSSSS